MGLFSRRRPGFPKGLPAVVQTTVLNGELPAFEVLHDDEGYWLVGDGVNDPNVEGAAVLAHMAHVVQHNPRVVEVADLPRGSCAQWCDDDGGHWHRGPLEYLGEDEEFQPGK